MTGPIGGVSYILETAVMDVLGKAATAEIPDSRWAPRSSILDPMAIYARSGIGAVYFDFDAVEMCGDWRVGFANPDHEVDRGEALADILRDAFGEGLD